MVLASFPPVRAQPVVDDAEPQQPSHRDRRKLETRRRVLAAARTLFERHGYDAVTIRMIADAAGVAVGSVFTTLPSKSAVLDAIMIDDLTSQAQQLDAAAAAASGVAAQLQAIFAALYASHDDRFTLFLKGISHSWVREPEAETAMRVALVPVFRRLERVLRAARETGEIGDDADLRLITDSLFAIYVANYRRAAYDAFTGADMAERMGRHIHLVLRGAGLRG